MVAALKSITLLSWLHTDSSPVLHRSQIASRATSCTSAMMEFMPCALAPAYGVTSICRFIQAATALSITSAVRRSYALAVLVAKMFCLVLFFKLADFDFIASACPHSVRHRSPALHPVFTQLVPTAFEGVRGFKPLWIRATASRRNCQLISSDDCDNSHSLIETSELRSGLGYNKVI